jgi:hypothetical protein
MEPKIIGRGLLAGSLAGVLAFLFARIFVVPVIGRAVDHEAGRNEAHAAMSGVHEHGMELFTRDVQSWVGLGFGVLAFSVAIGGLFAVGFVMACSRFPRLVGADAVGGAGRRRIRHRLSGAVPEVPG